jgi:hypothetical protein
MSDTYAHDTLPGNSWLGLDGNEECDELGDNNI